MSDDFLIVVLVLGLAGIVYRIVTQSIQSHKEIKMAQTVGNNELEGLRQDIALLIKDMQQVKEFLADLIIHRDTPGKLD